MADQIPLLLKALEVSPENWPTRRYIVEHFASQGDVDEAARLVKEAPEVPADEDEQIFASEILAKSDPQAAQSLLDEVLRANAACAQAHVVKAAIHQLAGDEEKANSHIKVAQVLDQDLDVESAIKEAVARPEAPADDLPLEVSQAVEVYNTGSVSAKAEAIEEPSAEPAVEAVAEVEPEPEAVVEVEPAVEAVAEVEPEPEAVVEVEAEPEPEAEVAPVPLSAVPLRPPGEREAEPEPDVAPDAAYEGSSILPGTAAASIQALHHDEDVVAYGADDGSEWHEGEHHEGERAFIVGEGELMHAHEKDPDAKEKLSAVTVAIAVHAALIILFGIFVIAAPVKEPPLITVSSTADSNTDDLPNQKIVKKQQKASASVQQATPVVTVTSYSEVAVPEILDDVADMSLVTLGNDAGTIGMSMTGLGDVSNMGSIPASMRSRCSMAQRMARLRKSGGEDRAERAVRNALEYLASKQNKETGAIGTVYPAAMTGLSLLAFLGHCETPESLKFGNTVIGSAQYLMQVGRKNSGMIFNGETGGHHAAYEHGIATYALAELYTMTKESGREIPQLESVLRKAIKIIVDGQTGDGGWLYGYKGSKDGDYSVSGWQIQALKAAYNTGKKFSGVEKALDKAIKYTFMAQDETGAIKYRLGDPKGKPTLAGAGVLALQLWDHGDSPQARMGLEYLDRAFKNPAPGGNFYAPYYNTQAYFMEGGKQWDAYNKVFQKKLLDSQNADGSWLAPGGQAKADGQIYATALGTLMLEVYYRYLPTTAKLDGLKID